MGGDIGVLVIGIVLLSGGSLAQAVKVFRASDPTAKYWGRVMLFSTIVMNISILFHLHIAVTGQGFGTLGNNLLAMIILTSPVGMVYSDRMITRSERTKSKSEVGS